MSDIPLGLYFCGQASVSTTPDFTAVGGEDIGFSLAVPADLFRASPTGLAFAGWPLIVGTSEKKHEG